MHCEGKSIYNLPTYHELRQEGETFVFSGEGRENLMVTESTFTFLFTDIEGSTRLWEQQPEAMRAALARQDEILRTAITAHDGRVFRTVGDALCAVFTTALAALNVAVEAQRALSEEAWELEEPLRVRIVLHTGEAEPSAGDFVGASLNRLGRMLTVCHGGQILLSRATQELVRDRLPQGTALLDLGQHRFRDLVRPERIFQVLAPGLPGEFPPLLSLDARPNNLPVQLTPFIGRKAELSAALRLLSETRLLTLTGPGGTGKTRLAIQTAAEALDHAAFPDGVWLVELAPLSSPDLVLPSIAAALNVREPHGRPLQAALSDFLRSKSLLLILDNCEHLIETCAQVTETLLQAGPEVKILCSSREPLGIPGESILRVPSFTLPDLGASSKELLQNEAVQLFVERATAVKPGFSLTPQNAPAIIQICRRLDGIPLAIELAAARVVLFSPAQIAGRLDDRFRLLTGGSRTAVHRQQTLEALIDWSYDLLSAEEQRLFHTVSVFAGGFTYEAAEAVFNGDVLDTLAQLVNKSLVQVEETSGAGEESDSEPRYRMLETIRQYARGKLLAAGEMEATRERHLAYFSQFSEKLDSQRDRAASQLRWRRNLENELDNLRAAIEWALERRPEAAIHMIADTAYFWNQHGYATEGLRWLEEGIAQVTSLTGETGVRGQQDRATLAQAYWAKGVLFGAVGNNLEVVSALEESVRLWREVGDSLRLARTLTLLGFWGTFVRFPNPYRAHIEEGLALGRQIEDAEAMGAGLTALGRERMIYANDYEAAQAYYEEGTAAMRRSGNIYFFSFSLLPMGFISLRQKDPPTAWARFSEALKNFQGYGDSHFANVARGGLADAARLDKNFPLAVELYLETIVVWHQMGNRGAIARCLECLAFIAVEQARSQTGQTEQERLIRHAGALLGAAEALREASASPMTHEESEEFAPWVTALKAWVPQKAFEAGWRQGREMDLDGAIALARS